MERGESSTWSEKFLRLSSKLTWIEDNNWKSNRMQCSVLRSFFIHSVVQYIKQWWCSLFATETQSEWAAAVGRELVGVLERGIWLLELCEMDWSTTSVVIPSGPAEFCEIVDDMTRYAKMMNMVIQASPLDSDRTDVLNHLQIKIDSDTSIMNTTLICASKQDQNVLLQCLTVNSDRVEDGQSRDFLKPLFGGQFPAEPNINYAHLEMHPEILGKGTFGTVFRAKCFDNLLVAVKEFNPDDVSFGSELKLLMKLQASDSSHILRVLGHSIDQNGRKLLVLELMEKDLAKIIQEKTGVLQSIDIIIQIAKAMKHVHKSKVIYRDMKPSNILLKRLNDQYLVKLADFGYSKEYNEADTSHTYLRGTLKYMAPEMLDHNGRESGEYTNKVDVFSFGMTCSEILSGKPPFLTKFKNSTKYMKSLLEQGERPELPEEIPSRLQELVRLCWHQDANKRPDFEYILEELWHVKEEFLKYIWGRTAAWDAASNRKGDSGEGCSFLSASPSQKLTLEGSTRIGDMLIARLRLGSEDCVIEWFREGDEGNLSSIKRKLLKGSGEIIEDAYEVTGYDVGSKISVKCFGVESTTVCASSTHAECVTGDNIVKKIRKDGGQFDVRVGEGKPKYNHKLVFGMNDFLLLWSVLHHERSKYNSGAKIEADENHPLVCTVTTERQQTYRLQFKTIQERDAAVSVFEIMTRERITIDQATI